MGVMIRGWLVAVAAVMCWCGAAAQEPIGREAHRPARPSGEAIEKQCEAVAEALSLEGDTRERFLKTYMRYQQEMRQIAREQFGPRPHHGGALQARNTMSEEQIEAMLRKRFAASRAILDVREKYFDAFLQFMTPRQIQRMYALEKRGAERIHVEHARRRPHAPMRDRE